MIMEAVYMKVLAEDEEARKQAEKEAEASKFKKGAHELLNVT